MRIEYAGHALLSSRSECHEGVPEQSALRGRREFDYRRRDVKNLSRSMAELEKLIEDYRTFATNATFSTAVDQIAMRKLLKRTLTVLVSPPDEPKDVPGPDTPETRNPGTSQRREQQRWYPVDQMNRVCWPEVPLIIKQNEQNNT